MTGGLKAQPAPDARERLPERAVLEIRRTRRHPRATQFDYLHLTRLRDDLAAALSKISGAVDVLDLFCGARPYDDLLPAGSHSLGLDIDDRYGVADVVSLEFLPFADRSFDLVLCIEAFHLLPDPAAATAEILRVLRPGGTALLTVPLVWEYDRRLLERRYTGPELAALFEGWDSVRVVENGGRAVAWATLSGWIVHAGERALPRRRGIRRLAGPLFKLAYIAVNVLGLILDWGERRFERDFPYALPMNLMLTARRPNDIGS